MLLFNAKYLQLSLQQNLASEKTNEMRALLVR